tara:strand:+ start:493 stop:705 length:213 start_codon:yes stop_codon:yes gene_type:complete
MLTMQEIMIQKIKLILAIRCHGENLRISFLFNKLRKGFGYTPLSIISIYDKTEVIVDARSKVSFEISGDD